MPSSAGRQVGQSGDLEIRLAADADRGCAVAESAGERPATARPASRELRARLREMEGEPRGLDDGSEELPAGAALIVMSSRPLSAVMAESATGTEAD